jgi:hypothetical protein
MLDVVGEEMVTILPAVFHALVVQHLSIVIEADASGPRGLEGERGSRMPTVTILFV